MAERRVIGKDNKLPWHFSSDLKRFKALTTGSTLIMGRKTYESIGKPLPNRENFVLSRSLWTKQNGAGAAVMESVGVHCFDSLESAFSHVKTSNAFVIGGAELYRQTIDKVDGIYLTRIHADYPGDAFYPEIPTFFREVSRETFQENPKLELVFYENTKKK